jgi:hypothetical protein
MGGMRRTRNKSERSKKTRRSAGGKNKQAHFTQGGGNNNSLVQQANFISGGYKHSARVAKGTSPSMPYRTRRQKKLHMRVLSKKTNRKSPNKSKRSSKGNSWLNSVKKARAELKISGFSPIKKGTPLYKRAKEIQ